MQNTKKLLSITNLKKYFPVAKTSLFQKEQLYVRANEDITLDIYEGETLGVVGESGCGKSTLGRVILQLYPQTAGTTMYYGSTLADAAPAYVEHTLKNLGKYKTLLQKAQAKAQELDNKVEQAGGKEKADFYLLQEQNLAHCEAQTCLNNIVKIMGGFFAADEAQGTELLLKEYEANGKRRKAREKYIAAKLDYEQSLEPEAKGKNGDQLKGKMDAAKQALDACQSVCDGIEAQLKDLRSRHAGEPEFDKYEAMRDEGIDLSRLKYNEMRVFRKDLQIIFQDPYSSLNPRMTIGQIIEEGLLTHNFYRHGTEKMRAHIVRTMEECGLQEYMLHRYPHQFSGGQRQRVAIARALAVQPKFIVCDECVSALDVSIQSQIINLLQELKKKQNLTYMFISHDLSVVRYISDRICVMYLGNVVELGDSETIFTDPRHPYTVALLSSIPTTDPESLKKDRILLEGNIPSPIKPPTGCKFHTRCYMACDKCKNVPPELTEVEPGHFLACHFPQKKLDEQGNYLFEMPKTMKAQRNAGQEEQADRA